MGSAQPDKPRSADEIALAERASDIRDAAILIRRAVADRRSPRALELNSLADQIERHFDELHSMGIAIWAPETLNSD